MEIINCPLCNSNSYNKLFMSKDEKGRFNELFYIVKCCECSLVFVNPRPAKREKLDIYDNMAENSGTPAKPVPEKDLRITEKKIAFFNTPLIRILLHDYRNYKHLQIKKTPSYIFKKILAGIINPFILKDIPVFSGEGKILDIGCNNGLFLYMLKSIGWKPTGLEINPSLKQAQESIGIEVIHSTLEDAEIPEKSFDAIRLSHVLEHLHEPVETIRRISLILKDSGRVYITVPNQRSFSFSVFKDIWFGAPGHLYCFSPFTLTKLCEKAGLRLKKVYFTASKGALRDCLRKYLIGKNLAKKKSIFAKFIYSKLFEYIAVVPLYAFISAFKIGDTLCTEYKKGASSGEILRGEK